MRHTAPDCPEGYYLYYMRGSAHGKFINVWLTARVPPVDGVPYDKHMDRKVALIQDVDENELYHACMLNGHIHANADPQELITSVCAVDRLTLGEPA